jgi:hypothetical protein
VVLQVDECRRIALFAGEEVFIDPQHLGTAAPGELSDTPLDVMLIPALDGGAADAVGR